MLLRPVEEILAHSLQQRRDGGGGVEDAGEQIAGRGGPFDPAGAYHRHPCLDLVPEGLRDDPERFIDTLDPIVLGADAVGVRFGIRTPSPLATTPPNDAQVEDVVQDALRQTPVANDIRVLLADDQGLVRAGFRVLLERSEGIEVIGEAKNGAEAVERRSPMFNHVVDIGVRAVYM